MPLLSPHGALKLQVPGQYVLRLVVFDPEEQRDPLIGQTEFKLRLEPKGRWNKIDYLRPLIDLCMAIARADGKLDRSEVRLIRDALGEIFQFDEEDLQQLREAMKSPMGPIAAGQFEDIAARVPMVPSSMLLELLAEVAKADGQVDPRELDVLRGVLGNPDDETWKRLCDDLHLVSVHQYYQVLGIAPGASAAEIKRAYRELIMQYHPDRVATLLKSSVTWPSANRSSYARPTRR